MQLRTDIELWAFCEEDERYMVSTFGRVKGIRCEYLIPFNTGFQKKYHTVKLGHKDNYVIHRLVAKTFLPNPNNLPEVDHIDRNPQNNHITNLRWVTRSENQINKGMPCNNTTGEKGVYYVKRKDRWTCMVQREKVKHYSPYYKTKEEAIAWRNTFLESIQ
jgi:hypothetical protein